MRRLSLIFILALLSQAQPLTTVTDVIQDAFGNGVTGSCVFRLAAGHFTGPQQQQIVREPTTIKFVNGVFSAKIVPTPAGQYYVVNCLGNRGYKETGNWIVPATSSVLKLQDLWGALPPSPGIVIPAMQISAIGLPSGQYCLTVVSGLVTGLAVCSGGGGGSPVLFDSQVGMWDSIPGLFDAH